VVRYPCVFCSFAACRGSCNLGGEWIFRFGWLMLCVLPFWWLGRLWKKRHLMLDGKILFHTELQKDIRVHYQTRLRNNILGAKHKSAKIENKNKKKKRPANLLAPSRINFLFSLCNPTQYFKNEHA
jgi:hypothetical protein